uniref:Uncharacterized protein n=1 Tax=Arundo donax TaxID=35708 RepID=A0A0A9CCF9_ARUDO
MGNEYHEHGNRLWHAQMMEVVRTKTTLAIGYDSSL